MKTLISFQLTIVFSLFLSLNAQTLDELILDEVQSLGLPGVAAGIIKDGSLVYEGYFGTANASTNTPVSEDVSFMLASVSKLYVHTAVIICLEKGLIDNLNDPINFYLPFDIKHPSNPDANITINHLLNHTSGIQDNWDQMPYHDSDDECTPLGEYLESLLHVDGALYDTENNFYAGGVGVANNYSNIGYALAAYVIEEAADQDFGAFVKENIFDPLCMEDSSFYFDDLDESNIAMPYGNNLTPIGHYSYSDYPSGRLRSSLRDQANFAICLLNEGSMDGVQILSPEYASMTLANHGGGDQGVSTGFAIDKTTGKGSIILINYQSGFLEVNGHLLNAQDSFVADQVDKLECVTTSIESTFSAELSISPNPSSDYIHLSSTQNINPEEVAIYQSNGQKMFVEFSDFDSNSLTLEIAHLPIGLYFVKVNENEISAINLSFIKK